MGLLMAGCGQKSEAEGRAGGQGLVVGSRTGDLAPDFSLQRIDGGTLDLASLKGKAVLIDFWDTWCPPCRRAMPHLQEISEAYAGDLVVIGVAMGRDGEEKVRSYVKNNGLTFEFVLADAPNYTVLRDYGGVQSIPTTFLVDRQGVIRNVWTGALPKAEYEKAVRSVLGV
jgi:peroxiredoxin